MTTDQIGIVITIFLVILSAVLIWDEIRAERRFHARDDDDHKPEKARQ